MLPNITDDRIYILEIRFNVEKFSVACRAVYSAFNYVVCFTVSPVATLTCVVCFTVSPVAVGTV